jgi:hypothetical protein
MSFDTKCWWRGGRSGRSPSELGFTSPLDFEGEFSETNFIELNDALSLPD